MFLRMFPASLLIFGAIALSSAQPLTPASASAGNGELAAVQLFEQFQAGTHHLYSGPAYIPYSPVGDEHPYFLRNELFFGKVKLDGVWYTDVPLKYDVANSVVLVPYYFGGTPIALVSSFIDAFVIEGHHFIHIRTQPVPEAPLSGFYEMIHEGPISLYVEHRKSFSESVVDLEIKRSFSEEARHFIVVNGQQKNVSSRRALVRLLPEHKTKLRAYLRKFPLATYQQMLQHLENPNP